MKNRKTVYGKFFRKSFSKTRVLLSTLLSFSALSLCSFSALFLCRPRSGHDEAVYEVGELEGDAVELENPPQIESDENRSAIEATPDPNSMRTGLRSLMLSLPFTQCPQRLAQAWGFFMRSTSTGGERCGGTSSVRPLGSG